MRTHRLALTALVALAAAAPVAAQQHEQRARGQMSHMTAMHCGGTGMMMQNTHADTMKQRMMQMMGAPTPGMILHHKQELGLSAEQIGRLETLEKQAEAACSQHMRLGMEAHQAANQLLEAAAPDFAAYTAKMKQAAGQMAEGHVAMAKAALEARAVLTPAQREKVKTMMGQMHRRH